MEQCADPNCDLCNSKIAKKRPYTSQYQSPNIVIVPTVSFCGSPSAKKFKCNTATQVTNQKSKPLIIKPMKENTEAIKDGNNKNIDVINTIKNDRSSWASNYLQSIGQEQIKQPTKLVNKIPPTLQKVIPTLKNENRHEENLLLTQLTNIHTQSNCNINQTPAMQRNIQPEVKTTSGLISQPEIRLVLMNKTDKHNSNKLHSLTKNKLSKHNDAKYKDKKNLSGQQENKNVLPSKPGQEDRYENSNPSCEKSIKLQTKQKTNKLLDVSKSKSNQSKKSTSTQLKDRDKGSLVSKKRTESRISSCQKCKMRCDIKTPKKNENKLNNIVKNASSRDSRKHVSKESNSTQSKHNEIFKEKHKNEKNKLPNKSIKKIKSNTVESNRATPIKSVVQITGNFDLSKSKKNEVVYDNEDLRRKLNKKSQNSSTKKGRDNLIITVPNSNEDNLDAKSQTITITNQPEQEIHTIKLVINVICKKSEETEKQNDDEKKNEKHQLDLSFLDDFNVDDIVECLNYCEDKLKSASTSIEKPLNKITHDSPNLNAEMKPSKIENSNNIEVKEECDKPSFDYDRSIYEGVVQSETSAQQSPIIDDFKSDTELNKVDVTLNDIKEERNMKTEIIEIDDGIKEEVTNNELDYKNLEVLEIFDKKDLVVSQRNNKNISSHKLEVDQVIDLSDNSSQSVSITEGIVIDTTTIAIESEFLNRDPDGLKEQTKMNDTETNFESVLLNKDADSVKKQTKINDTEIIEIIDLDPDTPEVVKNLELEFEDLVTSASVDKKDLVLQNPTIVVNSHNSSNTLKKEQIIDLSDDKETELERTENTSHSEEKLKGSDAISLSELMQTDINQPVKINYDNKNTDSDILNYKPTKTNNDNKTYKDTEKESKEKNKTLATRSLPKSIKSNTNVTASNCKSTVQISSITEPLEKRMSEYLGVPYTVMSLIHGGKYSKIFKCRNSHGVNFAVKVLNKAIQYGADIYKEDMLKKLQRDIPSDYLYCIRVINGFSLKGNWCFLTEYYPYDLKRVLERRKTSFHIDSVQELARQLVAAVIVLRNNNIVHLDIKPGHILLNNSLKRLKLCGFDAAQYADCVPLVPNIGMVSYRPPEVILGYSPDFGVDVWATALVLYEMATGRKLFPGMYNNDILYKQMCTLGNIPMDMVYDSIYKDQHFCIEGFVRKTGHHGKNKTIIRHFTKSDRLPTSIFTAYNRDWGRFKNKQQNISDSIKLRSFHRLLEQMLVLHPKFRLPIGNVYANSFIFDSADCRY